jgi:oligopeptide/dipeptide ABC transporter ATP-binding protein
MPSVEFRLKELLAIEGTPPSLVSVPSGCPFHPRCPHRFAPCSETLPELLPLEGGHLDRCHLAPAVKREMGQSNLAARQAGVS